ncbi:MAG: Exonuclease SbcD [Candidatus Ozemobacter sibiricus]|uniref:Nuclease SbcCD subunit D n=1 Tax=Candidatus Ozemobacter sibiricus TaxID=2268124 RepID=A0A367ZN28_9BACT|nr:MAG: Exonuclease SbcD [Candidatus Ozemobacter sibiricus]
MKILHTSDWHLGHQLYDQRRDGEHRAFLDWLLQLIAAERIDLVLVAGDVFDTGFPPTYALELYYSFLARCAGSGCRQVVVVGGNHDSPATLAAPREVLQAIRVTVVGGVDPDHPEADLVTVTDAAGAPLGLVAAVPYLRDRDVHFPQFGEGAEARSQGIIDGTAAWYRRLTDLALARRAELGRPDLPIIATGHLFAQGLSAIGSERTLYVGNLGAFPATGFPAELAYVALGHLHRPQAVSRYEHIRYCGAPIPLSFDEIGYRQQVLIVDTSGETTSSAGAPASDTTATAAAEPTLVPGPAGSCAVRAVPVPVFRPLVRLSGDLPAIRQGLEAIAATEPPAWVEIMYNGAELIPNLSTRMQDLAEPFPVRVLHARDIFPGRTVTVEAPTIDLRTVTPHEVFAHRLRRLDLTPEDRAMLIEAFETIYLQVVQGGPS